MAQSDDRDAPVLLQFNGERVCSDPASLGVPSRVWAAGWAIGLSALAFGAAHLPVLAMQIELDTAIVARTLLLNGMAGVVYGWSFWRYHLEAAMAAHAATRLGLPSLRALLG